MNNHRRILILTLMVVLSCLSLDAQERITLKTISQSLMGSIYSPNLHQDLPSFQATDVYEKVLFSPDGRRLLPQIGVALADSERLGRIGPEWSARFKKAVLCIDSGLDIRVLDPQGNELPKGVGLPVTDFHYSQDLLHWAVALSPEAKGTNGVTVVSDGRVIKELGPMAGFDAVLMQNAVRLEDGVLRPIDPIKETSGGYVIPLPIRGVTFSSDGRHLAYVVDTGNGKEGQYVVLDGQAGPRVKGAYKLTFSPDGSHFAYSVDTDKLRDGQYFVLDGQEQPRYDRVFEPRFSLDGKHFAYLAYRAKSGDNFLIYDGKEITLDYLMNTEDPKAFRLSPDGRYAILGDSHMISVVLDWRYRVLDMVEPQALPMKTKYAEAKFSEDGSKNLFIVETPRKMLKAVGLGLEEPEYFKIENPFLSPDGVHSGWAGNFRGKWVGVKDGQMGKPYLEIKYLNPSPDGRHVAYAAKNDQKKWVFVVDDREWGPYEGIDEPWGDDDYIYPDSPVFFSPDSQHVAVIVRQDKQASLVVDGAVLASFKKMGRPVFSPDAKRTAAWATDGRQEFIVLDGKPLPGFDKVDQGQIIFSPDSRHVAYKARKGKQWFVVVDDSPSANGFDIIATTRPDKVGISFSSPDSLYYVGFKGKLLYLIDEKIEAGPGGAK